MEDRILDLYKLPDISQFEDVHLITLRENCMILEEKLEQAKERMTSSDREILDGYIDMRNELEFQSIKAALRWGKKNYR